MVRPFRRKSSIKCSSRFSPRSGPELVSVLPRSRRSSKNMAPRLPSGARLAKEPPSPSVSPASAMVHLIADAGAVHPPAARADLLCSSVPSSDTSNFQRVFVIINFSTPFLRGVAKVALHCAQLFHPPNPDRAETRSSPRRAPSERARSARKKGTWPLPFHSSFDRDTPSWLSFLPLDSTLT